MSERVAVVWDDRLGAYDFGPGHPLAPIRVQLAMRLAIDLGLLQQPNALAVGDLEPASIVDLERVHDPAFIAAVQAASVDPDFVDLARGLGTADDPVFPGMHEAASRVAGATLAATRAVHGGQAEHAVNLAGGLHHAFPAAASGFCIYNDIGVAIAWLLDQGGAADARLQEVILATSFTAEGEATAHVLAEAMRARGLRATRLARGVPVGSELEYVDLGTIAHALSDRR